MSNEPGLAAFAGILADEHERAAARLDGLTRDFDAMVESSALAVADDEHDPEGSTIGFERAQLSSLVRQARSRLADVERAQERLRDGNFGICRLCGGPIGLERLRAHPTAEACIRCAMAPSVAPIATRSLR